MYLTALPDHSLPAFDERKHFSRFGNTNVVVNAVSSKAHCDNHIGCLSLKTVLTGEEWYGINNRSVAVRPGQFLILNYGQEYSCRIESKSVRTVSVFFARELAQAVRRDSLDTVEVLTDNPFETGDGLPDFFQTLRELDDSTQRCLSTLVGSLEANGYKAAMVEEQLIILLTYLLQIHNKDLAASNSIHGLRSSTRREIYRRVCIARDVLHSYHHEDLSLKSIASTSSLSVPQLVRQFKAAFGVTPHRYLVKVRLRQAADLLRTTDTPVSVVGSLCGFEDASAFTRAFKSEYRTGPAKYRNAGGSY